MSRPNVLSVPLSVFFRSIAIPLTDDVFDFVFARYKLTYLRGELVPEIAGAKLRAEPALINGGFSIVVRCRGWNWAWHSPGT
jgi:hypothetical protein